MLSRLSPVWLFATLWTIAHQPPLSMGFSRQEYWSGLACPPPGDLPNLGIEPESLMSLALAGGFFFFFTTTASWEAQHLVQQEPRQLQSAPREPYNKPLLSPRPICLLHRPNKQVQWGCGGNPHPYFFLVLDGDSNLQEHTISFIFTIFLGRGCSMTSTWSFPLC